MKFLTLILFVMSLQQCVQTHQPIQSKPMENNTKQTNSYYSRTDKSILNISDEEWKKILPEDLYAVARESATEHPGTGKYYQYDVKGEYYCAVCGNHLFQSTAKFASSCGWPSFFEADKNGVKYRKDISLGMNRIEVLCKRCNSHLGHVFDDGPKPSGIRFCMNSVSLDFEPEK